MPIIHKLHCSVLSVAALLGALPGLPAAGSPPAQAGAPAEIFLRTYPLRYLRPLEAEVLAWGECADGPGDRCRVTQSGIAESVPYIGVVAEAPTHARIARVLAQRDAVPRTQRFHVLLLVADSEGSGMPESLPEGAATALKDLRGFLPFTRYRVVDLAWVQAAADAEATLIGPDGLPIQVSLSFENRVGEELYVNAFRLLAPVVPAEPGRNGEVRPGRGRGQQLLATSFSLKVGETVVVGTSKLDGGSEALVTLVTAVP
jgi:hypothetical protein